MGLSLSAPRGMWQSDPRRVSPAASASFAEVVPKLTATPSGHIAQQSCWLASAGACVAIGASMVLAAVNLLLLMPFHEHTCAGIAASFYMITASAWSLCAGRALRAFTVAVSLPLLCNQLK